MVPRRKVVIAGASGFIGKLLAPKLAEDFEVIGLSRSKSIALPHVSFRECDLFSLLDAKNGLAGADYAVYLVHSMMPSARLTQGSFEDMDLIVADHFARAAQSAGIKQIIYLSGIIPDVPVLSTHLRSRLEVEKTLSSYGMPVTTLRAGLILGPEGSSFQILRRLVGRLPIMVSPAWTATKTEPVADQDVVALIKFCVGNEKVFGETYDIGSGDVISYREMMATTAAVMGKKVVVIPVPVFSPGLSRLWVSLVTGAPKALVKPLIQSLRYPMIAHERTLQTLAGLTPTNFVDALKRSVARGKGNLAQPRAFLGENGKLVGDVRSVQRLPLPPGKNAEWVAKEYLRWLPGIFPALLRVDVFEDGTAEFRIKFLKKPLLILKRSAELSTPDRQLLYIRGGLLAQSVGRGRLEFLETRGLNSILAAVHEYRPSLPWLIYSLTQAKVHAWVMFSFRNHLKKIARV